MEKHSQRALLIWNPTAGRRPARRRQYITQLAAALRLGGWELEIAATESAAGAGPLAAHGIQEDFSVLLAAGGDGTLHEIANALGQARAAGADAAPLLALAPLGTANLFAHAIGMPRTSQWHASGAAAATAAWLLAARPRPVLLGRARQALPAEPGAERWAESVRYFIAVASLGLDAQAVHMVQLEQKRRWGKLAYADAALRCWRAVPPPFAFRAGADLAATANGIIFGLTRFYGGRLRLGRVAADEPIMLAHRGAPWRLALQGLYLGLASLERAPGVERLRGLPIRIDAPGLPLELDGEPAGHTPVTLDLAPFTLPMLLR